MLSDRAKSLLNYLQRVKFISYYDIDKSAMASVNELLQNGKIRNHTRRYRSKWGDEEDHGILYGAGS